MDGATIMARLGLDTKGFKSEMANATGTVRQQGGAMRTAAGHVDNLSGAHDKLFTSSHRVANRIGSLSQIMLSGGDAASIFGSAIEGAGRSLHLSLGALATIAFAGVLVAEMVKVESEAQKLRDEIDAIARAGQQNPRFQTLEALNKQLDESEKKLKALQDAGGPGFKSILRELASEIGTIGAQTPEEGKTGTQRDAEAEKTAREAVEKGKSAVASKAGEENEIAATKLNTGDIAAERQKIEQTRAQKTGAAIEQGNVELQKQANREADIALAALDKKEAAQRRAVALEEKLTAIKREGKDVDVRSAEAKFDSARDDLHAAKAEDVPAAAAKVRSAAEEIESAKRVTAEKKNQVDLETRLTAIKREGYDVEVRSAQAKLNHAKAAERIATADERSAAAAKVQAAEADLLAAKQSKYPSLAEAAKRQSLADEHTSLLGEQQKPVTTPQEAREYAARKARIAEIEQQTPAPEKLGRDAAIDDQLGAYNAKHGWLTPEEQQKKNALEAEKFSRGTPSNRPRTQEEIKAVGELQEMDYQAAHDSRGLSPEQETRKSQLLQQLYGQDRASDLKNGVGETNEKAGSELTDAAKDLKDAAGELKKALTNQ